MCVCCAGTDEPNRTNRNLSLLAQVSLQMGRGCAIFQTGKQTSHTHTHTTRHTHTPQQGLTLCASPPTPWKSQPFHTEEVVCVIVPHKTHCWYWADSLQAQKEVDLPDRKTKQNRIKQLSLQHTHTHTHTDTQSKKRCICEGAGDTSTNMSLLFIHFLQADLSLSLSHTHTHTPTHTHTHISLSSH